MERGLYIAASGMIAEQMRQDQIANDLANASTPGYKADRVTQKSFADLLLSNSTTGQVVGPLGMGVGADKMVTDVSPQPLRDTGEPLDLAIAGEGFFAVQTAPGRPLHAQRPVQRLRAGHAHRRLRATRCSGRTASR